MAKPRVASVVTSSILALTLALVGCAPESDIFHPPVAIGVTTDSPGINYQDPATGHYPGFDASPYQWMDGVLRIRPQRSLTAPRE